MPRRKKNQFNIPIEQVRNIVLVVFVLFLVLVCVRGMHRFLMTAPLFMIKSVHLAPSLQFVRSPALNALRGKNIFGVDLRKVEKQVRKKYPQIKNLKIERHFPDQIQVIAKQREPLAQIKMRGKYYSIDKERVPLASSGYQFDSLPFFVNIHFSSKLVMGAPLRASRLKVGLEVVRTFGSHPYLSRYDIAKIDLDNLSKIMVSLDGAFDVIIDRDNIHKKIEMLGMLIAQHQLPLDEVRYIDLRFKEPIVGKKK